MLQIHKGFNYKWHCYYWCLNKEKLISKEDNKESEEPDYNEDKELEEEQEKETGEIGNTTN